MEKSSTTDTPDAGRWTLLQRYDYELQRMAQRVGKDRAASTYIRQQQVRKSVADFITNKLNCNDIAINELTPQFIADYALYLTSQRRQRPGTVWLSCQMLKSVIARACRDGLMARDPFAGFHVGKQIRPREYLTEHELKQLMEHPLQKPHLAMARDLFVFAALTGMSFVDISHLRRSDISDVNGETWVMARRHKTGVPFITRLLPPALAIVSRYNDGGDSVFARLNYRTLAQQIPLVMQQCGITKHITFHCARHTFAVMALNAGLPIESVSRILGHTNITTTQIYASAPVMAA